MKYFLSFIITACFFVSAAKAQDAVPGPMEQKLLDSLCNSIGRIDMSKISNKQEATNAFMKCFSDYVYMLPDVADEHKVSIDDKAAMHEIGTNIGKSLLRQKCPAFVRLSMKMAESKIEEAEGVGITQGTFKRIDSKGFNYFVLSDATHSEKSFLWLHQFPSSEKFMKPLANLVGKRMKIKWKETEVYLPQAKGYYKVKEVTDIQLL